MPVFRVNVFRVERGRSEEFLETQKRVAASQARIGGFTSRRVLVRTTGEDRPADTYEVHFEYPDWAAYAKFMADTAQDEETRTANAAARADRDPVATLISSQFLSEVRL
jgi:heme-degrading monooxygenase HmoA